MVLFETANPEWYVALLPIFDMGHAVGGFESLIRAAVVFGKLGEPLASPSHRLR